MATATIARGGARAIRRVSARQASASLSATLFYVFGPVPLYFAAARGFGGEDVALSGFVAVFATAGIFTALLSWWSRQPLALGWSLPGLLFMAASARDYSINEIAGASMAASVVVVALAFAGVVERVERAIPAEVAMAMLAGSALGLCVAPFTAFGEAPWIVGPALAGFLLARKAGASWFPPAAGAVLVGLPAAVVFGPEPQIAAPGLPALAPVLPAFSLDAMAALVPPLTVFVLIGNTQGRTVLLGNGFAPPSREVGLATGAMGAINAAFGGPPSSMQRVAMAVLTGDEAGPREGRWVAASLAAAGCLAIALLAVPLGAFTGSLDRAFIDTLIGLLLLKVLADALKRTTESGSMAGPIAFCIAASTMTLGGLRPEFWALAIGCGAAWFERQEGMAALPFGTGSRHNPRTQRIEGATPR